MLLFLKTWGTALFFLQIFVTLLIVLGFAFLIEKLSRRIGLSEPIRKPLLFITIFITFLGLLFGARALSSYYFDGEIQELFILNGSKTARLCVRFARPNTRRGITVNYTHRLKTFDLLSGNFLGRLEMARATPNFEYSIYGPFGARAWGINSTTGLQLLDLAKPALIADEAEILAKNPQLGKKIRFVFVDNIYDPDKHSIQAIAPDSRYFRITPDLKAVQIKRYSRPYSPRVKYWLFSWVPGAKRQTVRHRYASGVATAKSVELISPKMVGELNPQELGRKKAWVTHRSSSQKDSDLLLSYVDEHGQELIRINLSQLLKGKKVTAINTYSRKDEVLLFVSQYDITLSALRTDPNNGKILGRIDYFN
jgi:hypothetical protein